MGYTTEFTGEIRIEPPLNANEVSFLRDFNESRRMIRRNGPLFVKGSGYYGQGSDADVIDYNSASGEDLSQWGWKNQPEDWREYYEPDGQPGLWCQWTPSDDGTVLEWDGGEKFYNAPEWMTYLINKLLSPAAGDYLVQHVNEDERLRYFTFDHVLNGVIDAEGEEAGDVWKLVVTDNVVSVQH